MLHASGAVEEITSVSRRDLESGNASVKVFVANNAKAASSFNF